MSCQFLQSYELIINHLRKKKREPYLVNVNISGMNSIYNLGYTSIIRGLKKNNVKYPNLGYTRITWTDSEFIPFHSFL